MLKLETFFEVESIDPHVEGEGGKELNESKASS